MVYYLVHNPRYMAPPSMYRPLLAWLCVESAQEPAMLIVGI